MHDLWFETSHDVGITSTSMAVALSTLCGRAFDKVHFNFPVSQGVITPITQLTQAEVSATPTQSSDPSGARRGNLLSFSGGFDSLAARALMPSDTKLVSMDFGGRFSRERDFFDRFDTLRVSSNLLSSPLRRNSWSFMGIGAILASDFHHCEYHTFGGILEAGVDNMRVKPAAAAAGTFPPFRAAGYTNAPYVLGLTEVGTLIVLLQTNPELVAPSLSSLASPGEEKLYRKAVLTRLVADTLNITVDFDDIAPPAEPHFRFGQNFALDLLSLYVVSRRGDVAGLRLVSDMPPSVTEAAKGLDMAFMERANPTLYEHFPQPLLGGLYRRLGECGIRWYTERDWTSFRTVRELLAPYHRI
ncbi:hypothetical protein [Tessaracoccus antarcticus]|uniref:Uncharacterized protein n=1 Tax=Tessaracoccus antarcticus TaxID=2479848 RepID=A0A3M0GAC4_9ACTN|nr:hypothetical protein [Tessaracoccus antarcticus]RMB61237.1 hypothetical protein EAX62_00760 [Tessaracoccus antarcticus]